MTFLIIGAVILLLCLGWWRKQLRTRARKFSVTAIPSATNPSSRDLALRPNTPQSGITYELRLSTGDIPVEITAGDQFEVYADPTLPTSVKLYRTNFPGPYFCFAILGLAYLLVGILAFLRSAAPTPIQSTKDVIVVALVSGVAGVLGALGLSAALSLLRDFTRSARVTGRVKEVDSRLTAKGKRIYLSLLEYELNNSTRRVWAPARLREPTLEDQMTVRVKNQAPHEAVLSNPLMIVGVLLLLLCGLLSWLVLFALLFQTA